jgi:hypothetical protein
MRKNEVNEIMNSLNSELKESGNILYYPQLRYNELSLHANLILSTVMGWNNSGKPCFLVKDKIADYLGLTQEQVYVLIQTLASKNFIKQVPVAFKGKQLKAWEANMDVVKESITSSVKYETSMKIIKMKEELAELEKQSK